MSRHTLEEEEALNNYCRRMISHVCRRQQHPAVSQGHFSEQRHCEPSRGGRRAKESQLRPTQHNDRRIRTGTCSLVGTGTLGRGRHLPGHRTEAGRPLLLPEAPNSKASRYGRDSHPPAASSSSPSPQSQGPAVQLVPWQLISLLRHKTFKSEMQRAAEVNQHDPSVCSVCVAEQASLALDAFIRRKTTQIDSRRLEARLNMHLCNWDSVCLLGELARILPKPSDAPRRIWEELIGPRQAGHSNLGLP